MPAKHSVDTVRCCACKGSSKCARSHTCQCRNKKIYCTNCQAACCSNSEKEEAKKKAEQEEDTEEADKEILNRLTILEKAYQAQQKLIEKSQEQIYSLSNQLQEERKERQKLQDYLKQLPNQNLQNNRADNNTLRSSFPLPQSKRMQPERSQYKAKDSNDKKAAENKRQEGNQADLKRQDRGEDSKENSNQQDSKLQLKEGLINGEGKNRDQEDKDVERMEPIDSKESEDQTELKSQELERKKTLILKGVKKPTEEAIRVVLHSFQITSGEDIIKVRSKRIQNQDWAFLTFKSVEDADQAFSKKRLLFGSPFYLQRDLSWAERKKRAERSYRYNEQNFNNHNDRNYAGRNYQHNGQRNVERNDERPGVHRRRNHDTNYQSRYPYNEIDNNYEKDARFRDNGGNGPFDTRRPFLPYQRQYHSRRW